jgi:hypothetical protein
MAFKTRYKIVETDNFSSDYPDEKFINIPILSKDDCEAVCNILNSYQPNTRFWKVVPLNYILQGGFQP